MQKPGKVIVITAPSGAGKTTIAQRLLNEFPNLVFSVSATTRPPRQNEVHGKDYYFLGKKEFQEKIDQGDFLEWEEFYGGTRYGSLRSDVENHLKNGYFVLFDVEVKGAHSIKNIFGDRCLSLFICPPDIKILEQRLKSRGTENEKTLQLRLERAKMEIRQAQTFDVSVVNDDFNTAYETVKTHVKQFMNL